MSKEISFYEADMAIGDRAPFLLSLSDDMWEELRIIISAACVGEVGENIPELADMDDKTADAVRGVLAKTRPITPDESKRYEIVFADYITYQIRNESYCSFYPDEIRHGKYLITFEKSRLLSNLSNITDAQMLSDGSYYPGKWKHYGIYTQRHIIDVITHNAPTVTLLSGDE